MQRFTATGGVVMPRSSRSLQRIAICVRWSKALSQRQIRSQACGLHIAATTPPETAPAVPPAQAAGAVNNLLDNLRREQRQPHDAGHVRRRDPFAGGQFGDGGELASFEHALPSEGPCQRLDQRIVDIARHRPTDRQDHLLSPSALHDAERDMQGDGIGDHSRASHAAAPNFELISRANAASPPVRNRTFSPSVPISTRSTSSFTMRACWGRGSSPHGGTKASDPLDRSRAAPQDQSRPTASPALHSCATRSDR